MPDRTHRPAVPFNVVEQLEGRQLMSTSSFYNLTDLVSDDGRGGSRADTGLVNGWGLAASATGPWWVSSADKGTSIAYDGTGAQAAATVQIPPPAGGGGSHPTGVAANASSAFGLKRHGVTAPALYVFVTEDGTISGWNPAVDATHAVLAVDNSAAGAVYKGGAIGLRKGQSRFFAADFHNARIDVFDASFKPITLKAGAFTDAHLPAGYAPFNVANLGGQLFVSYALQDAGAHDDVGGPRHGFVDVYGTDGSFVKRFASRGTLDSPWAMVQAPHSFGKFADDILVGNFGNGRISAFNAKGTFVGFVNDAAGDPVQVDGLWGLAFGNDAIAGPSNTLFFAAGPNGESHGLFGAISPGKSHHHAASSSVDGSGTGTGY